jgi:hypothetical protein
METSPRGALQPVLISTDFQFGANTNIEKKILFPYGCLDYAPVFEYQIGLWFETYACVSYSFANACEILMDTMDISEDNKEWLEDNGYYIDDRIRLSNRFLAVRSNTRPGVGNSGDVVARTARTLGLAPLISCDWDLRDKDFKKNTSENYYDKTTINQKADEVAAEFAKRFEICYEWVNKSDLEEASKYGVVQVYVNAWYERDGKYYSPKPGKANHAVDFGRYSDLTIIDQYQPQFKNISSEDDFYATALKINIKEKSMEKPIIKNNTLIQLVSAPGGFGLFLDGFILVDSLDKILASWLVRTNGKTEGMVRPMVMDEWKLFDKKNLKGELI